MEPADGKSCVLEMSRGSELIRNPYEEEEEGKEDEDKSSSLDLIRFVDPNAGIDEDYRFFLQHLKLRNWSLLLEMENNVSVDYGSEKDDVGFSRGSTTN